MGVVRYPADASVRSLFGVPDSFVPGQRLLIDVQAASFSDFGGIVATADEIEVVDAAGKIQSSTPSSDSHPLLDIAAGPDTAIAWLPEAASLVWLDSGSLRATPVLDLPGAVVALRRHENMALVLVQERGTAVEIGIDLHSGNVTYENAVSEVAAPAIYVESGILFSTSRGLLIRDVHGSLHTVSADLRATQLERMSSGWIHASAPKGEFAINPSTGHVSQIPGVRP